VTVEDKARATVEGALGYTFRDAGLIEQALTHRSLLAEHKATASNEPLEFLGDAVLGFVVADILHRRNPTGAEGEKTLARARLVSTASLVRIGRSFDVASLLLMSDGDARNGGRNQDRAQEDAVEALVAAVYLDGGMEAARAVVERLIGPALAEGSLGAKDPKSSLQEFLQVRGQQSLRYQVDRAEGPDHRPYWRAVCVVADEVLGEGHGPSRKKAELVAAEHALKILKERGLGGSSSR
jgi:ribonuclease-3